MIEIVNSVREGLTNLASGVASFDWELLFVWCLLMMLDIITGYMKAMRRGEVSSVTMRAGIYRKMLDTFAILAVMLMQYAVTSAGISAPLGPVLMCAFCFKELTSILENTGGITALPAPVRDWLERFSGNGEKKDGEE
jgi:toxin secretion/phage lysis holin